MNGQLKNFFIALAALTAIMLISTLIVMGFNSMMGFTTDVNNEHVATSIAAVAFGIALVLKFLFYR